jgi:hypothetical protein
MTRHEALTLRTLVFRPRHNAESPLNPHSSIIERAADMDNASKDNDQPVTQSDDGSVVDVDLTAEYADDGAGKDADNVAKKDTGDYFSANIMGDETDDTAKTPSEVVSVGNGVDGAMDMDEDDMEEEADEVVEDVVEDEMVDEEVVEITEVMKAGNGNHTVGESEPAFELKLPPPHAVTTSIASEDIVALDSFPPPSQSSPTKSAIEAVGTEAVNSGEVGTMKNSSASVDEDVRSCDDRQPATAVPLAGQGDKLTRNTAIAAIAASPAALFGPPHAANVDAGLAVAAGAKEDDGSSAAGVPVANEKIIAENVAPPAPPESAAIIGHGNSDIPLLSEARRGLSGEQADANELDLPRSLVERDDGAVAASSLKLVDAAEGVNIASSGELLESNAPHVTDASVENGNLFASIHDLFPMNPDLMVTTKFTDVRETSVHVEQLVLAAIDASFAAAAPSVESGHDEHMNVVVQPSKSFVPIAPAGFSTPTAHGELSVPSNFTAPAAAASSIAPAASANKINPIEVTEDAHATDFVASLEQAASSRFLGAPADTATSAEPTALENDAGGGHGAARDVAGLTGPRVHSADGFSLQEGCILKSAQTIVALPIDAAASDGGISAYPETSRIVANTVIRANVDTAEGNTLAVAPMSSNTLPSLSPVRLAPVRAAENLTTTATATADGDSIEQMTAAAPASSSGLFPSPSPALSGAVGTFGLSAPAQTSSAPSFGGVRPATFGAASSGSNLPLGALTNVGQSSPFASATTRTTSADITARTSPTTGNSAAPATLGIASTAPVTVSASIPLSTASSNPVFVSVATTGATTEVTTLAEPTSSLASTGKSFGIASPTAKQFTCALCDVTVVGVASLIEHKAGKKHKKNMAAKATANTSSIALAGNLPSTSAKIGSTIDQTDAEPAIVVPALASSRPIAASPVTGKATVIVSDAGPNVPSKNSAATLMPLPTSAIAQSIPSFVPTSHPSATPPAVSSLLSLPAVSFGAPFSAKPGGGAFGVSTAQAPDSTPDVNIVGGIGSSGFGGTAAPLASFGSGSKKPVSFSTPQTFAKSNLNPGAIAFTPGGTFGLQVTPATAVLPSDKKPDTSSGPAPHRMPIDLGPTHVAEGAGEMTNAASAVCAASSGDAHTSVTGSAVLSSNSAKPGSAVLAFSELPTATEKKLSGEQATSIIGSGESMQLASAQSVVTAREVSPPAERVAVVSTAEPAQSAALVVHSAAAVPSPSLALVSAAQSGEKLVAGKLSAPPLAGSSVPPEAGNIKEVVLLEFKGIDVGVLRHTGTAGRTPQLRRQPGKYTARLVTGGDRGDGVELFVDGKPGDPWQFLLAAPSLLRCLRLKKKEASLVLTRLGPAHSDAPDGEQANKVVLGLKSPESVTQFLAKVTELQRTTSSGNVVTAAVASGPSKSAAIATTPMQMSARDELEQKLNEKKLAALKSLKKAKKPSGLKMSASLAAAAAKAVSDVPKYPELAPFPSRSRPLSTSHALGASSISEVVIGEGTGSGSDPAPLKLTDDEGMPVPTRTASVVGENLAMSDVQPPPSTEPKLDCAASTPQTTSSSLSRDAAGGEVRSVADPGVGAKRNAADMKHLPAQFAEKRVKFDLPRTPALCVPAPSAQAPSIPAPSLPVPSAPAQSTPAPLTATPSIPVPSAQALTVAAISTPVLSTPAPTQAPLTLTASPPVAVVTHAPRGTLALTYATQVAASARFSTPSAPSHAIIPPQTSMSIAAKIQVPASGDFDVAASERKSVAKPASALTSSPGAADLVQAPVVIDRLSSPPASAQTESSEEHPKYVEWRAEKARLEAQVLAAKTAADQSAAIADKLDTASARISQLETKICLLETAKSKSDALSTAARAATNAELDTALADARSVADKFKSWVQPTTRLSGVRMECRPLSAEDFFERLDTFQPTTWHAFEEVGKISPVECARHGWYNSDVNTLMSTDGATVRYNADSVLGDGGYDQHFAEVERVREQIVASGHKMLSQWIGSSCPASFAGLSIRQASKDELKTQADHIRKCLISGMVPSSAAVVQAVGGDEASALAALHWKLECLPATGRIVMNCAWCRSQCRPGDTDGGCIPRHYSYCPMTADDAWKAHASAIIQSLPADK